MSLAPMTIPLASRAFEPLSYDATSGNTGGRRDGQGRSPPNLSSAALRKLVRNAPRPFNIGYTVLYAHIRRAAHDTLAPKDNETDQELRGTPC